MTKYVRLSLMKFSQGKFLMTNILNPFPEGVTKAVNNLRKALFICCFLVAHTHKSKHLKFIICS